VTAFYMKGMDSYRGKVVKADKVDEEGNPLYTIHYDDGDKEVGVLEGYVQAADDMGDKEGNMDVVAEEGPDEVKTARSRKKAKVPEVPTNIVGELHANVPKAKVYREPPPVTTAPLHAICSIVSCSKLAVDLNYPCYHCGQRRSGDHFLSSSL
jgi:hypothetical protein